MQNQGKGTELLKQIVEKSGRDGRALYLETSMDRNLPWYQKHGFEVFQTVDVTYKLYMLRANYSKR